MLSELGRGSGSIVYLVRHQKLGEYRAVKRISKEPEFTWKIREAEILNHLRHPQIPHIYDIEEDEEAWYIVEEYMEGESLEALMLQSSFITLDFIDRVITGLTEVLDYLHCLKPYPLIYQDLKAEHVIAGRDGIKLIDFGISVWLDKTENKIQNYGTPAFCAPEKRRHAKISEQTDVFSMGKLLEELIFAEGRKESMHLMHIAKKAASTDLSERYASVREFAADFKKHVQSKQNSVNQKHLLKKIVAAGSQPRVGTTHLSISFTEYLNRRHITAVYQERNSNGAMRRIFKRGGFAEHGGVYRKKDFIGMPAYGEGVEVYAPKTAVEVLDYGADLAGALAEDADLFLFIVGSRDWELEYAESAYEQVKAAKGLTAIANYGSRRQARQYAGTFGQTVYCFPLDENPFLMTKEKERLFEGLLEKYWNCRQHPWEWGNTLIRSAGKLCGKRPG
ncbi:MAG: protein kinase [Lachnospiraceae bacterium]|nr:protein kinase [Lachnospiraceae bacterium]